MSGQTRNPNNSISSPVFEMTVMDSGGTMLVSPTRNFAAPIPPASAVIFRAFRLSGMKLLSLLLSVEYLLRQAEHFESPGFNFIAAVNTNKHNRHALKASGMIKHTGINGAQTFYIRD